MAASRFLSLGEMGCGQYMYATQSQSKYGGDLHNHQSLPRPTSLWTQCPRHRRCLSSIHVYSHPSPGLPGGAGVHHARSGSRPQHSIAGEGRRLMNSNRKKGQTFEIDRLFYGILRSCGRQQAVIQQIELLPTYCPIYTPHTRRW